MCDGVQWSALSGLNVQDANVSGALSAFTVLLTVEMASCHLFIAHEVSFVLDRLAVMPILFTRFLIFWFFLS